MINLIPPRGRAALTHEYVLRVASMYGFMLAGVFVAAAALMVPTYVLVSSQLSGARDESSRVEETREAFNAAFGDIQIANTVMAQLRKPGDNIEHSKVVEEIIRVAPKGIHFTSFQAMRTGVVLSTVQIQGTAENRIALATFKNTLEASPLFSEALVPISDLARDTDLPFAVTITIEGQEKSSP